MLLFLHFVLALLACVGHIALWIGISNRLHGSGIPIIPLRCSTRLIDLAIPLLPVLLVGWFLFDPFPFSFAALAQNVASPMAYLCGCWLVALVATGRWTVRLLLSKTPPHVISIHSTIVDVAQSLGYRPVHGLTTAWLARMPANQMFELEINEKEIHLPRLDPRLDGLVIVHVSDLHLSGKLDKPFFQELADRMNALDPHLVALTGDIVDKMDCIEWFPDTLGRLQAELGKFFIFGNHDSRIANSQRGIAALKSSGFTAVGGSWMQLSFRDQPIIIAGNELPWFEGPDVSDCPPRDASGGPIRILLSHSPDQIEWARTFDFDLVLAGHTHGGQIRLPLVGPIICPSRYGVKYASGVFYRHPTLMHVTRGISGMNPIRVNCRPELTRLVFRAGIP